MLTFFLIFLVNLVAAIFTYPRFISYLSFIQIIDKPDGKRKIHKQNIPRMGGLVIYASVIVSILTFYHHLDSIRPILVGSFVIVFCGIVDDVRNMHWSIKFIFQILTAILIIFYFYSSLTVVSFFGFQFTYPLNLLLTILFIIGALNAINMMDGMDGLLGGFSMIIIVVVLALSFYIKNPFLLILLVSLSGALLGFLRYNASPAVIFLGDTGSLVIGYFLIIATFMLSIGIYGHLDLTLTSFLLGVPISDTLKVILKRIKNKKSIFMADNSHLHYVISAFNIKDKTTVFLIQLYSLLYILISFLYIYISTVSAYIVFGLALLLLYYLYPLLNFIFRTGISNRLIKLKQIPHYFVNFYKKYVIAFILFASLTLLISSFPGRAVIYFNENMTALIFISVLFFLSVYKKFKWKSYAEISILSCWFIYFLSSKEENYYIDYLSAQFPNLLYPAGFILLAFLVTLFFFTRDQLFSEKVSLLNGFDLIIVVFISLAFILNGFMGNKFPLFIAINSLEAFLFYLSYKIMINVKPKLMKPLFYSSFLISFGSLLVLLFLK